MSDMTREEALVVLIAARDKRIAELLAANNRLLEERRQLDWCNLVEHWSKTFLVPLPDKLGVPDEQTLKLRKKLLIEEFAELFDGLKAGDLAAIADGGADLIWVTIGTMLACGIDLRVVFPEVYRSNMTKLGEDRKPLFDSTGKITKGPNFEKPRIKEVLGL